MLPNFLGLGAPKCATTWLFQCLRAHPDAYLAERKEVAFLDYGSIDGRLPEYEAHFKNAGDAVAVGEISTRYLASERAPPRVAELLPGCRLVVSLRSPPEQIYSHYWHLRRQNFHRREAGGPVLGFEQALAELPELLLKPAYYHRHLSNWLKHVDPSRLHVIIYDDIETRPAEVIRQLYAFLGLKRDFSPPDVSRRGRRERRGTMPRGPVAEKFQRIAYATLVHGVYAPMKSLLGVRRAERLKSATRARELLEGAFQKPGYPPMDPGTRSILCDKFYSEVSALSDLLKRDLSHWIESSGETEPPALMEPAHFDR